MTTQEAVLTTQDVANRYSELSKQNRWDLIQDELFAADAVSIEPQGAAMPNAEGLPAIKQKGEAFGEMVEEMRGGWCSEPAVAGHFFTVGMGMECIMKGNPELVKMDEVVVYEVRNGKIVKEQFFY